MTAPRTTVCVSLRDLAASKAPPERMADWIARLHGLLEVHAVAHGGRRHPTGVDVAMASFPTPAEALAAVAALWDEVEVDEEPGHRPGGVLGVGISHAEAHESGVGVGFVRALRLSLLAASTGEILVDDPVLADGLPDGFGAHRARQERASRLGFPFHHLADYRR